MVLDTYVWTGFAGGGNFNWSKNDNWLVNNFIPEQPPNEDDDLVFNATSLNPSFVDLAFMGTVRALTIGADYNGAASSVNLNRSLQILDTLNVAAAVIAGGENLTVWSPPPPIGPPAPSAFNWTGGAITGASTSGLILNPGCVATISGNATKTVATRTIDNFGIVNWTAGNIVVEDNGQIANNSGGVFNISLNQGAVLNGVNNGLLGAALINTLAATLNVSVANGEALIDGAFVNDGLVSLTAGQLTMNRGARNSGVMTLGADTRVWFAGSDTFLDSTRGGLLQSTINGTGVTYFRTQTAVHITGNVNVGRIQDSSRRLDGTGNLIVNGDYSWNGGLWAGTGTTQIGTATVASPQLSLAEGINYQLQRKLVNYGTVEWLAASDIQVSNGGSIENKAGALFDVQTDQTIVKGAGAGEFANAGTLRKSQGPGRAVFEIKYSRVAGGIVQHKSGEILFKEKVALLDGLIEVDPGTALVLEDGLDVESGALTAAGSVSVTGSVQHTGGTVSLVSGSLSATAGYNLGTAALLEGSGSITADILSDGVIDAGGPGAAGTLAIAGNYTQSANGLLNLEFGAPGDTDLLSVSGAVTLGGYLDAVALPGFAGGSFTVIDNTGPYAVSETKFAGLPEGWVFDLGGYLYQITYVGGDGNDVELVPYSSSTGQWASSAEASSEWNPSPGDYSAFQVLGEPNVEAYGDSIFAWAAANADEGIQTLTVGFDTPVNATGVTIRESYGNGFVTQIDLVDEADQLHTVWTGIDTSQPGSLADFIVSFPATSFLVKGVIIYVNTDHNPLDWEEIDAVMLHGDTSGSGPEGLSAPSTPAAGPRTTRVSSVRRANRGPSATLAASGPVALGTAIDFLFSNPRDRSRSVLASSFRYSFDFNNDGDFTDPGEVVNGTSPTARYTFTRRGWHIIHGRVRAADGRVTDLWLRVFVP